MSPIPFRRIKLFKGQEIAPRRPALALPDREPRKSLPRRLVANPVPYLVLFTGVLALLIAYLPSRSLADLTPGEIVPADVVAPVDLTLQDQQTTDARRREAEAAVLPVYLLDPAVFARLEENVRQAFSFGRAAAETGGAEAEPETLQERVRERFGLDLPLREVKTLARLRFPADVEELLIGLCGKALSRGVLRSKGFFLQAEAERGFLLVRPNEGERTVKAAEVLDVREAREETAAELARLDLPERTRVLLASLAGAVLGPNVAYHKVLTEERRATAVARVEPVFYTIKKGKVLVRKGDEAPAETVRVIGLINAALRGRKSWAADFAGTALLIALLLGTVWAFLRSSLRREAALKELVMMGTLLALSLALLRLTNVLTDALAERTASAVLARSEAWYYAFPFQMGTLLFAFLTPGPAAMVYAVMSGLLVGYLFGANFYLMVFSLVGGLAAIFGVRLWRRRRRTSVLRSGLVVLAPVNAFVILTIHLIRERLSGPELLAVDAGLGLVGALLGAALAFVLLPVFEGMFGMVTPTRLMELATSDAPILRRMALEAPGSFHHSLIVSTLAEKAAEEIGADPLVAKAGALYHDIGKIKRPDYFIENKSREDLHKELAPSMSTLVIINHVKEGLELARRLRLPASIREVIEQHHGTTVVRYFYQKAKEKYDPEVQKVGEEDYRYPGPAPQGKEAAVVMLADSVEAACRTLRAPTLDSLKRVITDIFNNYLQDGQLDDCDFSLRELRAVAASFLSILNGVYHPRVDYPGFEFENGAKARANGARKPGGGNGGSGGAGNGAGNGHDRHPQPSK